MFLFKTTSVLGQGPALRPDSTLELTISAVQEKTVGPFRQVLNFEQETMQSCTRGKDRPIGFSSKVLKHISDMERRGRRRVPDSVI